MKILANRAGPRIGRWTRLSEAIPECRAGFGAFWGWAKAGKGRERRRRARVGTGRISGQGYSRGDGGNGVGRAVTGPSGISHGWVVAVRGMDPRTGSIRGRGSGWEEGLNGGWRSRGRNAPGVCCVVSWGDAPEASGERFHFLMNCRTTFTKFASAFIRSRDMARSGARRTGQAGPRE